MTIETQTAVNPRPGTEVRAMRSGRVVAALAIAGMTASFAQTILIPIQGQLPQLLSASSGDTAWVITITLLTAGICMPIAGKLGDVYGKRRLVFILLGVLILGSVVAALSSTVGPLIVARALQGAGMGVIPLGIAILRDVVEADRLGSAIALVSATLGVGASLGLPLGALVTEHFHWHMLFWFAAAFGLIAIGVVAVVVAENGVRVGGRVDFIGLIGLAAGLSGVLVAISRGSQWGWTSTRTVGCLIGGLVVLLIWGWLELRVHDPLVDLRVSVGLPVLLTNISSMGMGFGFFVSQIAFPQLLELPTEAGGLGMSLLVGSLHLMPAGLAMLAISPFAGRLMRRVGPRPILIVGAAIMAAGYFVAVVAECYAGQILLINVLIGVGIGLGYAAMPTIIMRSVPASETGAAKGLNTLMRSLGMAIAAAAIAAVLSRSAVDVGGIGAPSSAGFHTAFLFGLGAAVMCALIACFIPNLPGSAVRPSSAVKIAS